MSALSLVLQEISETNFGHFTNVCKSINDRLRNSSGYNSRSSSQNSNGQSTSDYHSTGASSSSRTSSITSLKDEETLLFESIYQQKIKRSQLLGPGNLGGRRIYYNGRDILNLERNTQPYRWQLTSPLLMGVNPYEDEPDNTKIIPCSSCDFGEQYLSFFQCSKK